MIAIDQSGSKTSCTFVKGDCDNIPIVASDDENLCSATDDQQEDITNKNDQSSKKKVDTSLLRQTTASIADALLKLGGSEDNSEASSCNHSSNNRKRYISIVDTDASSTGTQSVDSETDIPSTVITKRRRRVPSQQALCSIPSSLCLDTRPKSSLHENEQSLKLNHLSGDSEEQASNSSTDEFQMEYRDFDDKKIPGEIGSFHESFRPLAAAPRLPSGIIAEFSPPMPLVQKSYVPISPPANMNSVAFSELDDFLIMHSYAVIPRPFPHHMARLQLPTGF